MPSYYSKKKGGPYVIAEGFTYADFQKVINTQDLTQVSVDQLYFTGMLYLNGATFSYGKDDYYSDFDFSIYRDYLLARDYFESAAKRGYAQAQTKYAHMLENGLAFKKADIPGAIFYYCQAALQNSHDAKQALIRLHFTLSEKLNMLTAQLQAAKIKLNTPDSEQIIKCFIALMDVYSYLGTKKDNDHQQMEKRKDFGNLLALAQDSDAIEKLKAYRQSVLDPKSEKSFAPRNHGMLLTWKGSAHYREHRDDCLFTLTHDVTSDNLKIAMKAFSSVISADAKVSYNKVAKTIMDAYPSVTPDTNSSTEYKTGKGFEN